MTSLPHQQSDLQRYSQLLAEARTIKGVSLGRDAWRRLRRNRAAIGALGFLTVFGLAAILVPLLPLQAPRKIDLKTRQFEPPNAAPQTLDLSDLEGKAFTARVEQLFGPRNAFDRLLIRARLATFGDWCVPSVCGADELGRDVLSRLMWGARVSISVGLIATLVSLVIGVSYGAVAGYLGGWVDNLMMRLVDILYSIPFIFVVVFIVSILDQDRVKEWRETNGIDRMTIFYLIIGAIYWLTMARVVRGQVISLKNEQFVEAARTIGASRRRIIFLHLVPNLLSIVIVYLTLTIPSVMLFEAFLSFLGLGITPPDVSWGLLANDGIQVITPVRIYWWVVVFPGAALATTLLALNFLGDGLRDALDPRMKNR